MILLPLSELPTWSDYDRVSVDIETRDDDLKKTGPGVRRGGYITGISFCCGDENGPAHYMPVRHEGGGNYDDPDRVMEYMRHQARHFRGDLLTVNGQYDYDFLAEEGVKFTPRFFRDIQISGPLLDQPTLGRMQDKTTGQWFWGEEFHRMSLNAQAERCGLPGKDEAQLDAWAAEHGLDPKADMWKAPAPIVAPYAIQDVRLPMAISAKHEREIERQNLQRVYDLESRLMIVLLKMRRRGVAVDLDKVDHIESKAWHLENKACAEMSRLSGISMSPEDTNKSAALARCLEADGVKVPLTEAKISLKTGKTTGGVASVKSEWLRELGTPLAEAILQAKKWNKVRNTFCASIREYEVKGRIHCTFNQLKQERETGDSKGAAFGRLSSDGPNLQQQPARDPEIGPLWRSIYLPDEGGEWSCLDFSGQEPRMIIHYAEITGCKGGKEAADACRNDPNWDNHSTMARMMYEQFVQADLLSNDWAIATAAKQLRGTAKTIFLGLIYGMGGGKLAHSLGLPTVWVVKDPNVRQWTVHDVKSLEGKALQRNGCRPFEMAGPEGQALLDRFRKNVPYVHELQNMCKEKVKKVGFLTTLSGRRCRFPIHPETGKIWGEHKGLNRLIQGGAGDQAKMAMINAADAGVRLQLAVHDELDQTIWDREEAEELNRIMVHAIQLNVPTHVDVEIGPSWGEIK